MMQRHSEADWRSILLRLAVVLAALLVVLVSLTLLYVLIQMLGRFGNVIVLFTLGAIVAYILNPAVNRVTALVGKRWAGMIAVYGGVVVAFAVLAVLLVEPLMTQSSSLVTSLRTPSTASLHTLSQIEQQATLVENELRGQQNTAAAGRAIPANSVQETYGRIAVMQGAITSLTTGSVTSAPSGGGSRRNTAPQPQLRVPPTYLAPMRTALEALTSDYRRAVQTPIAPARARLSRSIADAGNIVSDAGTLHRTVSGTPILLLDAQTWADQHHIDVNVQKATGQAVKKVIDQAASILNNTAGILTTTGNLLVDVTLILLISLYFVSDGARMIRSALAMVPDRYQKQANFFVQSVDTVLGQSIRANLACAAVAGLFGGAGALALGVPYAVLIGVSTFVLQLVPIIGAIILFIPPAVIALLFTTPTKAIILLAWFVIFEQIVTNVIGPRLTSRTVGIHPLEAMAAALVGYPLAGFLGSFLAVPVVGLVHLLAGQAYASWKARGSAPAGSMIPPEKESPATASDDAAVSTQTYAPAGGQQ